MTEKSKGSAKSGRSSLDHLHDRIESKINELHADFSQLRDDFKAANQSGKRARKDRIDGFKRALRDIREAADHADREWK